MSDKSRTVTRVKTERFPVNEKNITQEGLTLELAQSHWTINRHNSSIEKETVSQAASLAAWQFELTVNHSFQIGNIILHILNLALLAFEYLYFVPFQAVQVEEYSEYRARMASKYGNPHGPRT